jgi:hypothetical protein
MQTNNYLEKIFVEIKDFINGNVIFNDLQKIMNNLEKADSIDFAEIQNFLEKLNSANYSLQEIKVGLQKWDKVIYSMNIQNEINRINDIQTKIILLHEKIKNVP